MIYKNLVVHNLVTINVHPLQFFVNLQNRLSGYRHNYILDIDIETMLNMHSVALLESIEFE